MNLPALSSYGKINIILLVFLTALLGYSAVFPPEADTHPIPCIHQQITSQPCPTCGLSRSFSSMIRFDFFRAEQWNPFGPRLFLFFFVQWIFRIVFLILAFRFRNYEKTIIISDIILSAGIFLYAYLPLIRTLFRF